MMQALEMLSINIKILVSSSIKIIVDAHVSAQLQWSYSHSICLLKAKHSLLMVTLSLSKVGFLGLLCGKIFQSGS